MSGCWVGIVCVPMICSPDAVKDVFLDGTEGTLFEDVVAGVLLKDVQRGVFEWVSGGILEKGGDVKYVRNGKLGY